MSAEDMSMIERSYPEAPIRELLFNAQAATAKGESYEINHDAYFIGRSSLGVFDGVGRKSAAADAAYAASHVVEAVLEASPLPTNAERAEALMHEALRSGHNAAANQGGRTTASAIKLWSGDRRTFVTVGSVGDSLVLLQRDHGILQLSEEETWHEDEEFWARIGKLARRAPDDKELDYFLGNHPIAYPYKTEPVWSSDVASEYFETQRFSVLSALGEAPRYVVNTHELHDGDTIILTTDGVTDPLTDSMINDTMAAKSMKAAPKALIQAANNDAPSVRQKVDDRTVIVAEVMVTERDTSQEAAMAAAVIAEDFIGEHGIFKFDIRQGFDALHELAPNTPEGQLALEISHALHNQRWTNGEEALWFLAGTIATARVIARQKDQ